MDNIKDYEAKLASYSTTITNAQKLCDQAGKDLIVAETELKQYETQRSQIEQECKTVLGVPIEDADTLLKTTMESLEKITTFIASNLPNFTTITGLTDANVQQLESFAGANGINMSESAF